MKIARKSNDNIAVSESSLKQATDPPQWFFIRSSIQHFSFEEKGSFAVYDKDYRNVWTPRNHANDAIRWISSENPAKISQN